MRAIVLASSLVLGTLVTGAPLVDRRHRAPKFTSIVVFGDSFSDNGNGTFLLTNRTWPADPAYFDGRFSNGPVYPEYLLDMLGAHELFDFAFGGATINNSIVQGLTGPKSDIPVPSVVDQVNSFLSTPLVDEIELCSALAILITGVNDAFFAGQGLSVRALTDSLVDSVKLLTTKGFQTFVLPQTQPRALLPFFSLHSNPEAIAAQNQFSEDFKGNLTLSLEAAYLPPKVKIHFLDGFGALEVVIKDAEKKGLQPLQPCLNGAYGETSPRTLCDNPEEHIFFDVFHPSTETHKAIAESIAKELC